MTRTISVEQAAQRLESLVNELPATGEPLVLTRGGKPVAELRAARKPMQLSELRQLLEAGPRLSPTEAEAFAQDVEAGRKVMNSELPGDPWES